jgi:hypothetical protein
MQCSLSPWQRDWKILEKRDPIVGVPCTRRSAGRENEVPPWVHPGKALLETLLNILNKIRASRARHIVLMS